MIKEKIGKLPKDLDVKIGSKAEVFWTELRDKLEEDNLNSERSIEINKMVIGFAKDKISAEKEKFK